MAEVDTSSYPKPAALPAQKSILDQVGQYQTIERQNIALSQDKLKQINDQFNLVNAELATLANDPSITKDIARTRLLTLSKTFGFKPEVTNHMLGELNSAPSVKTFAETALIRGMATQEKVNNLYGTPNIITNQQQDQPASISPMRGISPMGPPIQRQIPPNQPVIGPDDKQTLQGPTAPVTPPGTVAYPGQRLPIANGPTPIKTQRILPVGKGNLTNDGEVTGIEVQDVPTPNQVVQNRYPAPSGPATGYSPLFEEGKKAYTADQLTASSKMLAAKPAIQALPLMQTPGFLSGPLTDQFTKIVAGLKSTGLINIADDADPTAIRQDVVKKLSQYVSNNPIGQRSDAAQTLREASSPNPNVQILPALIKLTKDAIALDRIEAAMPNAYKDKNFEGYIKHKGTFPQQIDEKAFTLDLEPEEKSKKLVKEMAIKEQSKNARDRAEAAKFFRSLRIAKEQGFYQ